MNQHAPQPIDRELILLVEDSPTQAMRTRIALEGAGFAVEICTNGRMALASIAEREPDLILLDMHLPDLSGREVAHRLKADSTLSGIPIIFLTGVFREVEDIISGLNEGADDYLCKPIGDGELIARVRATLRATKTQRALGRLARLLFTVNQVGSQVAGILKLEILLDSVVRLIHENFEYPYVHVYLLHVDRLCLAAAAGPGAADLLATPPSLPLGDESLAAVSLASESLQVVTRVGSADTPHPFVPDARSGIAVPFRSGGQIRGVLEAISPEALAFSDDDGLALQTLADLIGVATHNAWMYQKMEELATLDGMTALLNRRSLLAQLQAEWERCQRYRPSLALISLDIDFFKQVNDRYGHPTGDRAIQAVADLIRRSFRNPDRAGRIGEDRSGQPGEQLLGRLGGDEFLIMLPETSQMGALIAAERLRQASEALCIHTETGAPLALTLSLGVASWPETEAATLDDLLQAVDQALYRAKAAGRNTASL